MTSTLQPSRARARRTAPLARRILTPVALVGLVAGLSAPASSASVPTAQSTPAQQKVVAGDVPVPAVPGPADLVAASVQAADGQVAARILPNACQPSGSSAKNGLTGQASHVLDCVATAFPEVSQYLGIGHRSANPASDHPNGRAIDVMIDDWQSPSGNAQGWVVANFVAANAEEWNVKYVIWDAKIYTPGKGSWRPYSHPSGATDANNMHLNHVHVSTRA